MSKYKVANAVGGIQKNLNQYVKNDLANRTLEGVIRGAASGIAFRNKQNQLDRSLNAVEMQKANYLNLLEDQSLDPLSRAFIVDNFNKLYAAGSQLDLDDPTLSQDTMRLFGSGGMGDAYKFNEENNQKIKLQNLKNETTRYVADQYSNATRFAANRKVDVQNLKNESDEATRMLENNILQYLTNKNNNGINFGRIMPYLSGNPAAQTTPSSMNIFDRKVTLFPEGQ